MERAYDLTLAAAFLRGRAARLGREDILPARLRAGAPLTEEDLARLPACFEALSGKLYTFKRGHEEMPRVKKVMGFLRSVQPENLLDVGSGRGVFLFPFLRAFPWVEVTSIDLLPHRVALMDDLHRGGVTRLTAAQADLCLQPFPDGRFDVVTLLEVLEHIPDVERAVRAAVRMARRYVVVTVPSKPDDNPEHIHLLTKERLTELFRQAGCTKLHFDGVLGHLFLAAKIGV
ncbi:class I SAM-dependent methyltransferase [Pseudoflavonifractor phocaeensis]|uniref:class I SAM-dependent methyltransferase n=1 Tax=Pseudoflavonifractor phocaeensis TaxID=1870988 RepID=UPI001957A7FA|nr:class I SAM-dependent methyltransferase [Pseudoflavonifractor phocaeensis]MBM6938710.1 class I SAM-dependent methyltransferase [Pseudoflavonifractor phocaeensis]